MGLDNDEHEEHDVKKILLEISHRLTGIEKTQAN